jgi:hypothetical protein
MRCIISGGMGVTGVLVLRIGRILGGSLTLIEV